MEFLSNYGLFLAKAVTIVAAVLLVIGGIAGLGNRHRRDQEGHIEIVPLNERYEHWEDTLKHAVLDQQAQKEEKKRQKQRKKSEKAKRKQQKDQDPRKRVYVLEFDGDIRASAVENLREEITAILTVARESDEVVLKLESSGGMVHSYGLAASQLKRVVDNNIPLTVAVDKVAASGGYMMACVGHKILAAPFAILGSIGVVAQLPNFHRLLKKHDVDYEMHTAGDYKRTLTLFGENSEEGREKFQEELEDTHELFKDFVGENRSSVNIAEVSTGEIWFGRRAIDKGLVDELITSDDYLMRQRKESDIFSVSYVVKKSFQEKIGLAAESSVARMAGKWFEGLKPRF